jgi:hypothetical protein
MHRRCFPMEPQQLPSWSMFEDEVAPKKPKDKGSKGLVARPVQASPPAVRRGLLDAFSIIWPAIHQEA